MTPRELAGAIRRVSAIFVWVAYAEGEAKDGLFVGITKTEARAIVEAAKQAGDTVKARLRGHVLYIGA